MIMITFFRVLSLSTAGFILMACVPGARTVMPAGVAATAVSPKGDNETVSGLGQKKVPTAWQEWAHWVEKHHPVGDSHGHGPDIGSSEWTYALDRRLGISDHTAHGPDPGSVEWRVAVEKKLHDKRGPVVRPLLR